MKKHFSYLILGVLTIPLISELAKADTPSNSYLEIIDDYTIPNTLPLVELHCEEFFSLNVDVSDIECTKYGLGPAIEQNHQNIITNYNDIQTNSTDIKSNYKNIQTNSTNINTNKSNINSLGEGVAGSTALTAAISALPQMSKESKTTCGVGSGAYSSRYAVSFGCAAKVSERIDVNAGGSYVFGGSKSYGGGTLESGAVKAGFIFKLGELNKPTQISFKDKKIMDKKISSLEKNNDELKAKNDQIISQNQKLLARLEKLERLTLALKLNPDSEVISLAK